jgi:hypothetical protein
MARDARTQTLSGRLQQLLFSPKGAIEGLLIKVGSNSIQVSMEQSVADVSALAQAAGKAIEVTASPDQSPWTKDGAHPVYKLAVITRVDGKAFKSYGDAHPISGVVSSIHYAKHGEANGVVLKSGEFIHTRPPGMKKLKLTVGSKVVAYGELRMTVVGTPLFEAHEVNRLTLE